VVAALAGDWDSARNVELVLPETGVCTVTRSPDEPAASCGSDRPTFDIEVPATT
jgi:hypothetical protein